jgi:hypothetical protein
MIRDNVDNGELCDTSDMILQSPKDKKSKQNKTNTKVKKLTSQQNKTEQEEGWFTCFQKNYKH